MGADMRLTQAQVRVKQIAKVSEAILRREISRYPPFIDAFEQRYADFTQRRYGLSFCNGTSALEAALFAANVQPGDEVIVPSCTFHASIDPILNAGATPVFADVDANSFTLCPVDLAAKITTHTKAVIVVHLWGIPADMGAIRQIIGEQPIALIEDVSHAHGARWGARVCGAWGDLGVFSLQGSKPVAAGEGGMVVTDRRDYYLRMSAWGHFNRHGEYLAEVGMEAFQYTGVGYKRRMAPLGALLATVDLDALEAINQIKRDNVAKLDAHLGNVTGIAIATPTPPAIRGGFYQGYPIRIIREQGSATKAIDALKAAGIRAAPYPFPLHHHLPIYLSREHRSSLITQKIPASQIPPAVTLPVTDSLKEQLILVAPEYINRLNNRLLNQLTAVLAGV